MVQGMIEVRVTGFTTTEHVLLVRGVYRSFTFLRHYCAYAEELSIAKEQQD